MTVEALVPNDAQGSLRGVVSFLDNTVDTTTGTIRLKGTFPNGDRRLWPGQFVNVSLILGTRPNAIVIPAAAVQTSQQGQFVFVIGADKKAELRPVSPSISDKGLVVIDHGLRPGEVVVTDGVMRLTPGAQIEIKKGGSGNLQPSSPMGQK